MVIPKVYVIIVTYNGMPWIRECLQSLFTSDFPVIPLVLDNSSTDGTLNLVRKEFSGVEIIKQSTNLGFGKANNIGIRYALNRGADFVFLLNQDAKIYPNTIKALVNTIEEYPEYGILSPIHLNWEGNALEYYFSRFVGKNHDFFSDYVLNKKLNTIYDVPFVNAASWLLPRKILETIGGFDPIFRHYGEDNNYCQRVLYHGFKIGVFTGTYICHDAKKRVEPNNYLFSESYYLNEIKQWQIKYANINNIYNDADFNQEKLHILKLILINILKFNWKGIKGYLKKYKIFRKKLKEIKQSRQLNAVPLAHYLEL